MAKKKSRKLTAEEQARFKEHWAALESQLDIEWPIHQESRLQVARVLYEMKKWLKDWGMNKGRNGKWNAVLRKHNIPESTANDYVRLWQEHKDISEADCVLARVKKSLNDCENNSPESDELVTHGGCKAKVKAGDHGDEENYDNSTERRVGIECVFCLTMAEKHAFMEAVDKLGPHKATQEIYKAIVAAGAVV